MYVRKYYTEEYSRCYLINQGVYSQERLFTSGLRFDIIYGKQDIEHHVVKELTLLTRQRMGKVIKCITRN